MIKNQGEKEIRRKKQRENNRWVDRKEERKDRKKVEADDDTLRESKYGR